MIKKVFSQLQPKNFPFYYGWFLLPFASLGVMMSIPGQTAGFSAFTESLLAVSGISRTALSSAYLIGTISSGFLLPSMGKVVDLLGSRKMMVIVSLLLGLTLLFLSQVEIITHFLNKNLSFFSSEILFMINFIFGIFCLRFFGQGMFPLVSNTMVGKWFEKYRGKAVAVMGVANTLAFAAAPAIMNAIVSANGWKQAWLLLAFIEGVIISFIVFLVYRKNPESCGLHVDGISPVDKQDAETSITDVITGFTLKEARGTLFFWILGIGLSIQAFIITGFTFHIEAIGLQTGISVEKAVAIFLPVTFISVPLSFTASWVSDKVPIYLYSLYLALGEIIAFVSIFFLNSVVGYIAAIIGMGIASGLMGPIISTIIPKLYGRKHLGAINGAVSSMLVIGSALGPIVLSIVNDYSGSFGLGILVSAIFPFLILILSLLNKKNSLLIDTENNNQNK